METQKKALVPSNPEITFIQIPNSLSNGMSLSVEISMSTPLMFLETQGQIFLL